MFWSMSSHPSTHHQSRQPSIHHYFRLINNNNNNNNTVFSFCSTMRISVAYLLLASSAFCIISTDAFFSSLATRAFTASKNGQTPPPPPPRVQRKFETWTWNPTSEKGVSYEINYKVSGNENGPPVLLTHGFGANLNHFRFTEPALVDAGYKVYSIDLLGFGASEKATNAPYSVELFASQIQDFIVSRNDEEENHQNHPWILVGNSLGSLCSLQVAAAKTRQWPRPKFDISAMVLFNSAGGMTGFRYTDLPVWAHPIAGHAQYFLLNPKLEHGPLVFNTLIKRPIIETVMKNLYVDHTNVDDDLIDILLQPAFDDGATDVFLNIYTGPAGPIRESLLSEIASSKKDDNGNNNKDTIPILCLWGSDDNFVPLSDDDKKALLEAGGSELQLEVVENAGHCLHDEHPHIVNTKMLDFLSKQKLLP